ncbi:hypothetical protein FNF28_06401 [Cafeteria roenbergensis]|uniref:Uncharacterized protein n=1 Tax=Cafeteria roenbergensis TaxID=33653 RepID=A0A5A8D2B3_CAFRO|nr:hypothetical protein FNF28_06401 [Cafeteria roenbergensis]
MRRRVSRPRAAAALIAGAIVAIASSGVVGVAGSSLADVLAAVAELRVVVQPAGARGGEAFDTQPVVEAVDASGQRVGWLGNTTRVSAEVVEHGTGSRFLALNGSATSAFADFAPNGTAGEGTATFSGLSIAEAPAEGVVLRFALDFPAGVAAPWAASTAFNVSVGPAVRLGLRREPGAAEGGLAFRAQPVVEVQDAGGNRVDGDNSTTVTAALVVDAAAEGNATLSGAGVASALTMVRGSVSFRDLAIDVRGVGYVIRFTAVAGPAARNVTGAAAQVDSPPFTVGTGPTAAMRFVQAVGGARGGIPFLQQPVVELVDAGGNVNELDNHSTVTVSVVADPTLPGLTATLSPAFLYHPYPLDEVRASVGNGSVYVNLTGSTAALQLDPPLLHGDRVTIGDGAWEYPPRGLPGALVRLVAVGGTERLRLDEPWAGPAAFGQRLTRQSPGLTARVVNGRASFVNLTLDRAGSGFRLLFTSSLRPDPEGTLLGRGRRGMGRVGYGFGYGADLPDPVAAYPNDYDPPFQVNRQDSGPAYLAASAEVSAHGFAAPWPGSAPAPNITLVTDHFVVGLGDPDHLRIDVPAAGAWAGGQPFLRQPVLSLRDAGGNLLVWQEGAVVTASLTADPTGGALPALSGFVNVSMVQGQAEFLNLAVSREGVGFQLSFHAAVPGWGSFSTSQRLDVLPSAEWQVSLPDAQPGDRAGESVAVSGDVLVAGSPHDRAPTKEIQIVETTGDSDSFVAEIQAVGTAADAQLEVQEILFESLSPHLGLASLDPSLPSTPWHPGANGSFAVLWGDRRTAPIPVQAAHAAFVQVVLEQEMTKAGSGALRVSERRFSEPVTDANGTAIGARQVTAWAVTFVGRDTGPVEQMQVDGSGLGAFEVALAPSAQPVATGASAQLPAARVRVQQVSEATVVDGAFTLSLTDTSGAQLVTPPVPHNATALQLRDAIQAHLGTGPVSVSRHAFAPSTSYPNPGPRPDVGGYGGFVWSVTFSPTSAQYDPPTFVTDSSLMEGPGALAWASEVRRGRAPISGSFSLYFRGQGPSPPVPFDATASELEAAVEALPTVVDVSVDRAGPNAAGGFRWAVTFERTANVSVEWDSFVDDEGDSHFANVPAVDPDTDGISVSAAPFSGFLALPALAAPDGVLAGTGARVSVDHVQDRPTPYPWVGATMGRPGLGAGSVVVAERRQREWRVDPASGTGARLKGSDTGAQDHFGWSVAAAANGSVVVVGAPGAEANGVLEQQRIRCRADGGTFRLSWRGHATDPIPFSATAAQVQDALQLLPPLHSVMLAVDVSLVPGGDGLTPEQAAVLPVCSASNATGAAGQPGAELLGRATVVTFLWPQDGDMEPIEPAGAALSLSAAGQNETGFLAPLLAVEDDYVRGTRRSSGANATGVAAGAVYVFGRDEAARSAGTGNQWAQTARLEAPAGVSGMAGSMFGASIAASADTIVVGAPQSPSKQGDPLHGSVFVFVLTGNGNDREGLRPTPESGRWALSEHLFATTTNSQGETGALFGAAVALWGDTLAVGAPGQNEGAGQVFVFKRFMDRSQSFLIDQVISPPAGILGAPLAVAAASNAQFGAAVALGEDVLLVGAPGGLNPHRRSEGILGRERATGCALVFDRPDFGEFFQGRSGSDRQSIGSPREVLAPTAARSGDRVGHAVAVSGHVAVVGALESSLADATPRLEVQMVSTGLVRVSPGDVGFLETDAIPGEAASQPTNGTEASARLGGSFALQWRRRQVLASWRTPRSQGGRGVGGARRPSPVVWRSFQSRKLPFDAPARDVKRALEEDLGTGRVNVTRIGPAKDGGFRWLVTFVGLDDDVAPLSVPLLRPVGGALTPQAGSPATAAEVAVAAATSRSRAVASLDQAVIAVHRVSRAPDPVRGAAYLWRREPASTGLASGYLSAWWETAALSPFAHQRVDQFGWAVAVDGNTAVVGAPNRDQHNSGVNAGAAVAFDLGLLNVRIEGAAGAEASPGVLDASEGDGGIDVRVTRCGDSSWPCLVPSRPGIVPGVGPEAASEVYHVDAVSGTDWGVYDGPEPRAVGASGPAARWGLAADAARAPAIGPPFCLEASEGTQDCEFLRLGDRFGLATLTAFDVSAVSDFAPISGRPLAFSASNGSAADPPPVMVAHRPLLPTGTAPGAVWRAAAAGPAVAALPANSSTVRVVITDDTVAEAVDETLHVRLSLPGIQPLFAGHLWAAVRIGDDGDGTIDSTGYAQRITAEDDDGDGAGSAAPLSLEGEAQPAPPPQAMFGAAVAVRGAVAVSGAPGHLGQEAAGGGSNASAAGRAFLLRRVFGIWEVEQRLLPPPSMDIAGASFGAGVALSPGADVAAVSSSGRAGGSSAIALHIFRAPDASGFGKWELEASLVPVLGQGLEGGALSATDGFGETGSVALTAAPSAGQAAAGRASDGASLIAAVGCPGKEAVFVFRSAAAAGGGRRHVWAQTAVLRSSAWRPFRWLETWNMIPEAFGASVAASRSVGSGGSLVIGAPLGDHGNISLPTSYHQVLSLRSEVEWRARGAAYVFQFLEGADTAAAADPASAAARLGWPGASDPLATVGNTPSEHVGPELASANAIADAGVGVSAGASSPAAAPAGVWAEHARLVARRPDASTGGLSDRLGASVAVDGPQLIVGAPGSPAQPATTWDFEAGDLRGWTATGSAFDHQPTMGDNPRRRPGYPTPLGPGKPSPGTRLRGRYFVGTFENRTGNLTAIAAGDPTQPSPFMAGSVQGDGPTGTLTSDPFIIGGPLVSMLVGGGCDATSLFVELLVDGLPSRRATGTCSEEMRRVQWDVSRLMGRAARLRVSDLSSGAPWGHINVDDFRFAWDIGRYAGTPRAGAAYVYRRYAGGTNPREPCAGDLLGNASVLRCGWEQQARLAAADKRRAAMFGAAVAVDAATGTAAVGAPGHSPVHPDWAMPGFTPGVRVGLFGELDASPSGDAGLNALPRGSGHGVGQWLAAGDVVSSVGSPGGASSTLVPGWAPPPRFPPYLGTAGVVGTSAGNLWAGSLEGGGSLGAAQASFGPHDTIDAPFAAGAAAGAAVPLGLGIGAGFHSPWLGGDGSAIGSRGGESNPGARPAGLLGGSGPGGSTGKRFGSASSVGLQWFEAADGARTAGGQGPFDSGDSPFDYAWDGLSAASRARSSASAAAVDEELRRRRTTDGRWTQSGGTVRQYAPSMRRPQQGPAPGPPAAPAGEASWVGRGLGQAGPEGVLYLFRRDPERRGGEPQARLVDAPAWSQSTQHAAVRLPWSSVGAGSGSSLALDGDTLLAGAPRDSTDAPDAGSVTGLDVSLVRAGFESTDYAEARLGGRDLDTFGQRYRIAAVGSAVHSYAFPEGFHLGYAVVPVFRAGDRHGGGASDLNRTLHVRYATRGVTAQGVTARKAEACKLLPLFERSRARCGDYVDVAGVLEFAPGVSRRDIIIPLVDDDCPEPEAETLQIHLGTPGGVTFDGEEYAVTLRIDDDDLANDESTCLRPLQGQ